MPDDKFIVHDITISETPLVGLTGAVTRKKMVRYFIGDSGPFMDVYDVAEYTADKARAAIDDQVKALRTVHAAAGS